MSIEWKSVKYHKYNYFYHSLWKIVLSGKTQYTADAATLLFRSSLNLSPTRAHFWNSFLKDSFIGLFCRPPTPPRIISHTKSKQLRWRWVATTTQIRTQAPKMLLYCDLSKYCDARASTDGTDNFYAHNWSWRMCWSSDKSFVIVLSFFCVTVFQPIWQHSKQTDILQLKSVWPGP